MLKDNIRKNSIEKLKNKGIIVFNDKIAHLYLEAEKAAKTNSSILITGESGSGKDSLARYIHDESNVRSGPFIYINCSAIPSDLFVSEMFGYMPGTFTDATLKGKKGLLESADHGTIMLDEIGDLALENQVVLLDFLQRKRVRVIGSMNERIVDVRVISATNKDLQSMISEGTFRKDLYYRICIICLNIPPLRQRRDEIPMLINYFANELSNKSVKKKVFSEDAIEFLSSRDWVGNIRELQNIITQIFYLEDDEMITRNHIDGKYKFSIINDDDGLSITKRNTLKEAVEEFECDYIIKTLLNTRNFQDAARLLGISQATLYRKVKHYNINMKHFNNKINFNINDHI